MDQSEQPARDQQRGQGEADNTFQIKVSEWAVAYTAEGNLTAQCRLQPDDGVQLYSASISVSSLSAPDTPLFFGGAGNNGLAGEWFAVCGSPYPDAKGTTVVSTISGLASSSPYGYLFRRQFKI